MKQLRTSEIVRVIVIRQTIDDDHRAARTKTFVAGGREVLAASAAGFLNRLFNDVGRNLIAFGFLNQASQSRIGIGVRDAILGNDVQLLAILGVQLRFLTSRLEDRILAIFEISSHNNSLLRLVAECAESSER